VNLRGEYDVSLDSNYLTKSEESSLALLQGIHIGSFEIKPSDKFVSEEFLNRPKGRWVKAARLACQQISNKNQKKRLKWALVPSGYVLANSCNFISIESSAVAGPEDEHLHALLGILNSKCLEDRFNAFSPNNHVSNREINDLPVGDLTSKTAKDIAKLVMKITSSPSELELESLENLVLEHFGLESEKLTNKELT
jgi:Alw26I/Eco31I/Esp3I family type II restriction m6 adenine DNA methyltransferase